MFDPDEPEILGLESDDRDDRRAVSWRWAGLILALALVGGIAVIWQSAESEQRSGTTTTSSPEPSLATESPATGPTVAARTSIGSLSRPIGYGFVAPSDAGYIAVFPDIGVQLAVDTDSEIVGMASGGLDRLLLHRSDGVVERVFVGEASGEIVKSDISFFQSTAEQDGVWVSTFEEPDRYLRLDLGLEVVAEVERQVTPLLDPRFMFVLGTGTHRLLPEMELIGPHQMMAVGPDQVVGRICDDGLCTFEWWQDQQGWRPLQFSERQLNAIDVDVDPMGERAALLSADATSVQIVEFGEASLLSVGRSGGNPAFDFLFSGDGAELILLDEDRLRVIDLVAFGEESISLLNGSTQLGRRWTAIPTTQ